MNERCASPRKMKYDHVSYSSVTHVTYSTIFVMCIIL